MRWITGPLLASALLASTAHADEWSFASGMPRLETVPMSAQIADGFTELGTEIDAHLAALSLDLIGLRVDGRARAARLRLGRMTDGGGAQLGGRVQFARGKARVVARLQIELGDHAFDLDLPAFELVPRSEFGERYVEVRVPLVEGTF